jgi:hypothetical protein
MKSACLGVFWASALALSFGGAGCGYDRGMQHC